MPDVLSFNPSRALDAAADGSPGAKAYFYDSGTTTLRTVYSDAACTLPHATPLVADATGSFAAVFSNASAIKVVVTDSADATLYTIDPCVRVSASGAAASAISFTPTVDLPFDNVQAAIEGSVSVAASGYAAFGLGVTGSVALLANLDATATASGQYRFDGTTTGTFPTGVTAANTGAIDVVRETSSSAWMYLYHDTTNAVFIRRMNASVWGTWREVPTGATTVGKAVVAATDASAARTAIDFPAGLNASGSAPLYACRAWVQFNGTGAVAIRGSGNVSSITDNGTGDYTVNFTVAMPDTNFATIVSANSGWTNTGTYTTTTSQVQTRGGGGSLIDANTVSVAIFR